MYKQIAVAMLFSVCAPLAGADVVELAPDLYLVVRLSREDVVAVKVGAIREASEYAASAGRVAVPVTGRLTWLGPILKEYEYQFRLMSRAEALAAKPTLADVVVSVDGGNTCGSRAAPRVAALLPELSKLPPLSGHNLLAGNERKMKVDEAAPDVPATAVPWLPPPVPGYSAQ